MIVPTRRLQRSDNFAAFAVDGFGRLRIVQGLGIHGRIDEAEKQQHGDAKTSFSPFWTKNFLIPAPLKLIFGFMAMTLGCRRLSRGGSGAAFLLLQVELWLDLVRRRASLPE